MESGIQGTSNLVVDDEGQIVEEYVSLSGTAINCSGGITPWGTWLTCEENEEQAGGASGYSKDHGWVFEVDPYDRGRNADPFPLTDMGRFVHEGWPSTPTPGPCTRPRTRSAAGSSAATTASYRSAYFVSSFADAAPSAGRHDGQVWRYDPRANTLTLELIFTGSASVDDPGERPDNMCVSPYGGLMICEDSSGQNHMIGTTADGEPFLFARNRQVTTPGETGELSGCRSRRTARSCTSTSTTRARPSR